MLAESPSPESLRSAFQGMLNSALTRGHRASGYSGLGPRTIAAIDAVACDHPEADTGVIAAAYDAFDHEHGA